MISAVVEGLWDFIGGGLQKKQRKKKKSMQTFNVPVVVWTEVALQISLAPHQDH
jgi:hypothetical protein